MRLKKLLAHFNDKSRFLINKLTLLKEEFLILFQMSGVNFFICFIIFKS